MAEGKKVLGILGGGGPAPGMNQVLSSAAIAALNHDFEVIGIKSGFKYLMQGDHTQIHRYSLDDVTMIGHEGGFITGMARDNPTKRPEHMKIVIETLRKLGVTHLIGIGGDDTNTSLARLANAAEDIAVVGIPKTIDNDIGLLPQQVPTFGYETARHYGDLYVKNFQLDAQTGGRWFFLVVMGRSAGYLVQGIGISSSAAVTIIPEEIPHGSPINKITDVLTGAIVKRLSLGYDYGVALIGEGVIERIVESDIAGLEGAAVDEHGHIRFSDIHLADILRKEVGKELSKMGVKMKITPENLGYILRANPPIAFDKEYCRMLGWGAVEFLLKGGKDALISVIENEVKAVPFAEGLDAVTGRIPTRQVELNSPKHHMCLDYQFRIKPHDFRHPQTLESMAKVCNMSAEEFRKRFGHLVE